MSAGSNPILQPRSNPYRPLCQWHSYTGGTERCFLDTTTRTAVGNFAVNDNRREAPNTVPLGFFSGLLIVHVEYLNITPRTRYLFD